MASIETLIAQIQDETLKAKLAREFAELKKRRSWGLIFERHLPEATRLLNAPIFKGAVVWERRSRKPRRFIVRAVDGDELTVVEVEVGTAMPADAPTEVVRRADVLVEHDLSTPIYPTLTPTGGARNGPPERPAHAVIQGENHHALEVLLVTHQRSFDLIYIDPPYNTGNRDWIYNNDYVDPNDTYRPSKWLAFMERRLRLARRLLEHDGVLVVTIDENEVHHLGMLLEQLFPDARQQMVTVAINPSGTSGEGFSRVDEYVFFCFFGESEPSRTPEDFFGPEDKTRARWWHEFIRSGTSWLRAARPNLCYPIKINQEGRIAGVGEPLKGPDEDRPLEEGGSKLAWPVRTDGRLGIWSLSAERVAEMAPKGYVVATKPARGTWSIRYLLEAGLRAIEAGEIEVEGYDKYGGVVLPRKKGRVIPKTMWHRVRHAAGAAGGTGMLSAMLGDSGAFTFPKSLYAVRDVIDAAVGDRKDARVLDFFAGSGTTLHATMLLNVRDGGQRRCVLVTNNEVKAEVARRLNRGERYRGDREFEASGVFEAATRPRVTAAVTGVRPDGKPVQGEYLDGRGYAEGFEENIAFFRLDYLDPDEVEFGMRFNELHPLLWLWAGGVGEMVEIDPAKPLFTPTGSPYAVLFDPSGMPALIDHLEKRVDITHVFIVAESEDAFEQLASDLLAYSVKTVCLYRDYVSPLRQVAR